MGGLNWVLDRRDDDDDDEMGDFWFDGDAVL